MILYSISRDRLWYGSERKRTNILVRELAKRCFYSMKYVGPPCWLCPKFR